MDPAAYSVALALQYHQAGNLRQAEELYRQALQADPYNADAHHLLGVIACQCGQYQQSVLSIRHALSLKSDSAPFHANLGFAYAALGQFEEAVLSYQQALRLNPLDAEVHYKLGAVLHRQNKLAEAVAQYRQALRLQPAYADVHNNLGSALAHLGNYDEALTHYQRALQLRPDFAEAYNNLGMAQADQGKFDEAEANYRRSLDLKPDSVEALNNLGNTLAEQGKLDQAATVLQRAIALRPEDAVTHYNFGTLLHRQEKLMEAVRSFQRALQLKPAYPEAHNNLALVLLDQDKFDEALTHFHQALALKPDYAEAHNNFGIALAGQGKVDEAIACCGRAIDLGSVHTAKKIRVLTALLLPTIYQSTRDILNWRQRLTDNVQTLHQEHVTIDLTNETAAPCFHLVYQGLNDRDLQCQLSSLYTAPAEPFSPPGCQARIRVGFISRLFKEHTIGRLMGGLVAQLSCERFHVTVLSLGNHDDALAHRIRQQADQYLEVPGHLPAARRLIADQHLDLLFYTDIGMDRVTYSLAFSRLAPVQCVTWGHPVTTGIPTMDYFVSSEHLESEQWGEHYTEKLVRLKSPAIYYQRPAPPARLKCRAHFGLPETGTLYACPQSLFKLHPEFDEILGGILRRDPRGTLVLIRGRHRHWQELLLRRFTITMPDVVERVQFVPPLDYEHFLNLNALADVLLDPLHFGGGNTSYEGLALGVPIVTLPTPFLRARITAALYQQMGLMDCVVVSAAEYIDLAVKLGTDVDYRAAMSAKILAANDALFENSTGIRELEQFFEEAVRRARAGLGPICWPLVGAHV